MMLTRSRHNHKKNDDEDDDSSDEEAEQRARDAANRRRLQQHKDNYPSGKKLNKLANDLHDFVSQSNNDRHFGNDAKKADTFAVGINGNTILVAGNIKERRGTESTDKTKFRKVKTDDGKKKLAYENYGITDELAKKVVTHVKKSSVYKNSDLNIQVIEEKMNPRDNNNLPTMIDKAKDHTSKHAESKIQASCKAQGDELLKVGVNKPPCKGCHEDLSGQNVDMNPSEAGTKKVTSRRQVTEDDVEVRREFKRREETEITVQVFEVNHNLHDLSAKAVKQNIKANVKNALRPGASVGLISGKDSRRPINL
jgi:hypothetical protein